ncbi:MAG: malate dehydrogenase [Candidatus Aenigmarchaeota archaeon]|nr:malate dehydrogenase [Candidatus Aenigmarchaeota archaeon]
MTKIVVIGTGKVGSMIAYEIAMMDLAKELVLIDKDQKLAEGHALDIRHCMRGCAVKAGSYSDTGDADIAILAAGKPRTPDIKTRLELARTNAQVIREIASKLRENGFSGIVITLTNPLDVMNHLLYTLLGLPAERVIGFSCHLDSSRFRCLLSERYAPETPSRVEAFVIGEHGDGQVPLFSRVAVDGKRKRFTDAEKKEIMALLRGCSMEVIGRKGATVFAPACCVADMLESIVKNRETVIPCSLVLDGEYGIHGVSIGVPAALGKGGAAVKEWDLAEDEALMLAESAGKLKDFISIMRSEGFP